MTAPEPAATGPMTRTWDEHTAPLLRALQALRAACNRATDRAQVGDDVGPELGIAYAHVLAFTDRETP